ncbi:hypothetical protein CRYUN_Cryun12cG0126100 [Craigia yunnanensis]
MTIVSLTKYAFIVLSVDDDGEGGTFALYSLLCRHAKVGLLPNDKSANDVMHYEAGSSFRTKVESRARRAIAKHKSSHYLMLFLARFGSCLIIGDAVLTPAISVLSASSGLRLLLSDIKFSSAHKTEESISENFKRLSAMKLRSEAMFADLGHFSIQEHVHHVFVILSLLASAIGSQATITACFSIINQCLALGCFPRVKVVHTSDKIHGQVYIPDVNWILMILSLGVTIGFHDTVRIGKASGMAIVSGMLVTTCLMSLVIALYWEKSMLLSASFLMFFGSIEAMYLSSSMLNFHKGAWYLVVLLVLSLTIMVSWHYVTMKKYEFDLENKVSTEWLTNLSPGLGVSRVPGIGFIYTNLSPAFFSHFITNLPAFHQVLIFVSFKSLPVPFVSQVGDDFEEQIIRSILEFISLEEHDSEPLMSPEGRMIVVGRQLPAGNALIPLHDMRITSSAKAETQMNVMSTMGDASEKGQRKMVQFLMPASSPKMRVLVREELQELIEARKSGTAYSLGQSHLAVRNGSNFLKQLLIMTYVFFDKNCGESHVALNIPHEALVEVGMVYTL